MSNAIDGLKPAGLWKYFAELSKIPRRSKHEAAVGGVRRRHGQEARPRVRPGHGRHGGRAQAGVDGLRGAARWSACRATSTWFREKRPDKKHDFLKDPITLVRKGNAMMADGTTLGADNGVAVATSLAIMEDASLVHGPLEFLFTIDEETGLTGAHNLQPGFLKSQTLLNLDSEEEGALYVGCSGGRDTMGTWALETEAAPAGTVGARDQGGRPARRPLGPRDRQGPRQRDQDPQPRAAEAGARSARGSPASTAATSATPSRATPWRWSSSRRQGTRRGQGHRRGDARRSAARSSRRRSTRRSQVTAAPCKGRGKVVKKGVQKKLTHGDRGAAARRHQDERRHPGPGRDLDQPRRHHDGRRRTIAVATSQRSSVASEIVEIADRCAPSSSWRARR